MAFSPCEESPENVPGVRNPRGARGGVTFLSLPFQCHQFCLHGTQLFKFKVTGTPLLGQGDRHLPLKMKCVLKTQAGDRENTCDLHRPQAPPQPPLHTRLRGPHTRKPTEARAGQDLPVHHGRCA